MGKIVVIGGFTHAGITESGARAADLDSIFIVLASEILDSLPAQGLPQTPSHAIFGTRNVSRQLYMSGVVLFNYFRKMGHETHLINTLVDRGASDSAKLAEAEFVMISTSHMTAEQSIRSIELVRSINLHASIIVGGWTAFFIVQAIRSTALKYSPVDAERILADLRCSGANYIVASRAGLDVATAIVNGRCVEPVVFDDTIQPPISDPELFDLTGMPRELRSSPISVTTAQGCPFACSFCS